MANARSYHHGDLRNALVQAGLALLEEKGAEALSLRAIALRAGVSHAAPTHHFGNLRGLLTALAAEGFSRFASAMAEARAAAPSEPRAQVYAAGCGYVGFARAHPALFQLMFTGARLNPSDPALNEASQRAYEQLTGIVSGLAVELGIEAASDRAQLELIVWAFAHGFAHLPFGPLETCPMPDLTRFLARPPTGG